MYADDIWNLLYDEYLPFRLHAEFRQGTSIEDLVHRTGMPAHWIRERIAAAEDCIESGQKLAAPFFDRRGGSEQMTALRG